RADFRAQGKEAGDDGAGWHRDRKRASGDHLRRRRARGRRNRIAKGAGSLANFGLEVVSRRGKAHGVAINVIPGRRESAGSGIRMQSRRELLDPGFATPSLLWSYGGRPGMTSRQGAEPPKPSERDPGNLQK